ncbi:MAG: hypothetical protein AB1485_08325 [Candidatus Thermoplasmatota archaeon]
MGARVNEIDCANCLIYDYHTYNLPKKIVTKEQKYQDQVLVIACRTCFECSNYVENNPNRNLNECEIRKLEVALRKKLGNERYEEEIKKIEKEKKWYIWGKENLDSLDRR